jgi:hypothetical protein
MSYTHTLENYTNQKKERDQKSFQSNSNINFLEKYYQMNLNSFFHLYIPGIGQRIQYIMKLINFSERMNTQSMELILTLDLVKQSYSSLNLKTQVGHISKILINLTILFILLVHGNI